MLTSFRRTTIETQPGTGNQQETSRELLYSTGNHGNVTNREGDQVIFVGNGSNSTQEAMNERDVTFDRIADGQTIDLGGADLFTYAVIANLSKDVLP